ncbi:Flp family type IVb pilin [Sneathiella chinensis]|uniref:Flp family type IVb pilin n=1 Tax=Sneathiella chinensis TaxID=349750 RepID=A0ABQ5U4I6_9PROT|nr:Flp family type IVb pilin [Sneathiella chinensis]GLQ06661.1 hypothetical protein GCM10007924_18820 [Sneathiella chinensis]
MKIHLKRVLLDESGVTSVEYALLAAAAAVGIGAVAGDFYGKVGTFLSNIDLNGTDAGAGGETGGPPNPDGGG